MSESQLGIEHIMYIISMVWFLIDIKECSEGLHNCTQRCEEFEGGFSCACFEGYKLENDSVSCKGIACVYVFLIYSK